MVNEEPYPLGAAAALADPVWFAVMALGLAASLVAVVVAWRQLERDRARREDALRGQWPDTVNFPRGLFVLALLSCGAPLVAELACLWDLEIWRRRLVEGALHIANVIGGHQLVLQQRFVWSSVVLGATLALSGVVWLALSRARSLQVATRLRETQPEFARAWLLHPGASAAPLIGALALVSAACAGLGIAVSRYSQFVRHPFEQRLMSLSANRPALEWSVTGCMIAVVLAAALLWFSVWSPAQRRARIANSVANSAELALRPAAVWCSVGVSLGLAALLLWSTAPLAAENAQPLPVGNFSRPPLGLPAPASARMNPVLAREGPVVVLSGQGAFVDGHRVSTPGALYELLKHKQELWRHHYPGKQPPGIVNVQVEGDLPTGVLHAWLERAVRANYVHVDFLQVHEAELRQPLLGRWTVTRWTALQTRVGRSAPQLTDHRSELLQQVCQRPVNPEDPHVLVPLRDSEYLWTSDLLAALSALRRTGKQPCLETSSRLCPDDSGMDCFERFSPPMTRSAAQSLDANVMAQEVALNGVTYQVVTVADAALVKVLAAPSGQRGQSIRAVEAELRAAGQRLLVAMNAGMFEPDYSAVGLLVSDGRQVQPLNLRRDEGNFYLWPNGVFALPELGPPMIVNSVDYEDVRLGSDDLSAPRIVQATQSGPLLLLSGSLHPRIDPASTYRATRNGVGVAGERVFFASSTAPVTFYELAQVFTQIGVANALYLDGNVSTLYAPGAGWTRSAGTFGPLLVVSRPGNRATGSRSREEQRP